MESNLLTFHIKYPNEIKRTTTLMNQNVCKDSVVSSVHCKVKNTFEKISDFYEKLLTNWLCDCVDWILLSKCVFADFGWQLIIDQWVFFFVVQKKNRAHQKYFQKSGEKKLSQTTFATKWYVRCISYSVSAIGGSV